MLRFVDHFKKITGSATFIGPTDGLEVTEEPRASEEVPQVTEEPQVTESPK